MTREEFRQLAEEKIIILDGATGSNLIKAGMPNGVCPEKWIIDNPKALIDLQRDYVRSGSNIVLAPTFTGNRIKLAEYGLEWTGNGKEVSAIIKPVAGAEMYLILPEDWAAVKTDVDKAAFFSDGVYSVISDFRGVSAWNSKDYDYVIGTLYNGEYHMIHITHGEVQTITNSQGQTIRTDITITGQSK